MTTTENFHTVNWFEIPTLEIGRAQKFYETVMDWKLEPVEMEGMKMAVFPGYGDSKGASLVHGALIEMADRKPSDQGAMIYFNAGNDLTPYLERVERAGGQVVAPKTSIGPHGFFAMFKDTEGNIQALHSPN